jgi:hypothetical protein
MNEHSDWTGNGTSVYKMIGASNHSEEEREQNDYYATDPKAIDLLLDKEIFSHEVWECASGEGHISERLKQHGYSVRSSDIIKRTKETEEIDFLKQEETWNGDIITNPPYKLCSEFIVKALSLIPTGHKVAMLLKLTTLEGQKRYNEIYRDNPPEKVLVFVKRIECARGGKFTGSSAVCYSWFIWEKGFKGKPTIDWLI